MTDVLLATCAEHRTLGEDEALLIRALDGLGLRAGWVAWNDPGVDWGAARIVVLRYVFDYVRQLDGFLAWLNRVATTTAIHNPPELVRWNSHKGYLRQLESSGIPIIPTLWPRAGEAFDLEAALHDHGWTDAVVKPAVGNGARGAMRVDAGSIAAGQAHLDELLDKSDAMIQPYVRATEDPGERALIHFAGEFSHAISKDQMLAGRPFSFDRTPKVDPDERELALAKLVLSSIPEPPLYARVDTVVDGDVVRLMELEVIEPVLFFSKAPGSADRFAAAIERVLG